MTALRGSPLDHQLDGPRALSAWRSSRARRDLFVGVAVLVMFVVAAWTVNFNQVLPALGLVLGHGWDDELLVGVVLTSTLGVVFSVRRALETDAALRQLAEAHALSRVSFDDSPLPMAITDPVPYAFCAVNDAACREYGWSRAEFMGGMTILDLYAHGERADVARRLEALSSSPHILQGVTHQRRDGGTVRLDVMRAPVQFERRDAVLSVAIDVTVRERLADERRATLARYEAIFKAATAGIVETDENARVLDCNRAYAVIAGRSRDTLIGMSLFDFIDPQDQVAGRAMLADLRAGQAENATQSMRYRRPDGSVVWVLATASVVPGHLAGGSTRLIGVVLDSTEREILAQQSRESLARFSALFNTAAAGIVEVEVPGLIRDCNDAFARMLGSTREQIVGRHVEQITHPSDVEASRRGVASLRAGDLTSFSQVKRYLKADGSAVWGLLSVAKVSGAGLATERHVAVVIDLSERMRAEEERAVAHERLQLALDAVGEGLWDWNIATDDVFFSATLCRMLGYEVDEFPGKLSSWAERVHPDDRSRVQAVLDAHVRGEAEGYETEHRLRCKDGRWLWVLDRGRVVERDSTGKALRMVGTHADITPRRDLEEQLRQAQKMEAVGQLAGGVAHDFNNLLTVIRTGLDLALAEGLSDVVRADLSDVEMAAERATALTSQLLAFSRRKAAEPRLMHLNDAVGDLTKLLHRVLPKDISVRRRLESNATVLADPGQVGQALLNLAVNARDAMPSGGVLTFSTYDVRIDTAATGGADSVPAGEYSVLTVVDTGVGMSAEVRQRIFEPFFTTKAVGKGTGLGLASVYGMIKQLGGHVRVESAPNQGATFRLYFPVTTAPEENERALQQGPLPGGTELVRLVEDEPAVRNVAARMLHAHGYRVREAANGRQALDLLEAEPGIACVLTDIVMPVMSGGALFGVMRERHPDVASVVMSAHAHDVLAQFPLPAGAQILEKPFLASSLLTAVRQAIDARVPS